MKVGFVGLGKLGLPCALAASRVHDVAGYDRDQRIAEIILSQKYPYREAGVEGLLQNFATLNFKMCGSVEQVVIESDLVFLAVQTPHQPEFEGSTPLTERRADFDYSFLKEAVYEVSNAAKNLQKHVTLAVISTVLPGTSQRELLPLLDRNWVRFAYNPLFIAMGTTIRDYLKPEFVLIGADDARTGNVIAGYYEKLHDAPHSRVSVASAELAKVSYNTFIGMKIVFANTLMQVAEHLAANVDEVTETLSLATDRLISPAYMRAGMGDGGACHPRDNIALSWLSRQLFMDYDLFGDVMRIREQQTRWLAHYVVRSAAYHNFLPIVVLGTAFKAETNITTGSCSVLLVECLKAEKGVLDHGLWTIDPEVTGTDLMPEGPAVYVHATPHKKFRELEFAEGSVMVDPWGNYPDKPGLIVERIGRR